MSLKPPTRVHIQRREPAWLQGSLAEIARALRTGKTSAAALFAAADARRTAAERPAAPSGAPGPYLAWEPDHARRAAAAADRAFRAGVDLGPLQGVPVSVKDLFGVRGFKTFAGSPKRLPGHWEVDGTVIKAIRHQLGVMVGKTHMVEFAFGGLGVNTHWGTPANPWDRTVHRVPGGSSSGAGLSLLEGSAVLALGTDTAGSVRVPASMTGTVGLKLTLGRWPTDRIVPLSFSFDTPGLFARSVEDVAIAFSAIESMLTGRPRSSARPAPLSSVRIGVCDKALWDACSPGVAEAVEHALSELEGKGAHRLPLVFPQALEALNVFGQGGLAGAEMYGFLAGHLPSWLDTLDPVVRGRVLAGKDLSAWEYLQRRERLDRLTRSAPDRLRPVHVAALPTVPITPPIVGEIEQPDAYRQANMLALRNTVIANFLGLCAITIPVGLDAAGMPVGLQLMAPGGAEESLLSVALAVERALGPAAQRIGKPPSVKG